MSNEERIIRTQIEIDAPVEAVWKALTDAQELSNWFPPQARVKPGKGGSIWVSWSEAQTWETPIAEWDENRRLKLIYMPATPPEQVEKAKADNMFIPFEVAVEYTLEARGGQTVLRIVHTGFASGPLWDVQYDGTVRGWDFELRGLKHYLERHRGTRRTVVHARHALGDLSLEDAWRLVCGPGGLAAKGTLESVSAGERLDVTDAAGNRLDGTIVIHDPPRALAAFVDSLNAAYLRVKCEEACFTGGRDVDLWLSTYGLDPARTDRLQRRWDEMLERLFAGVAPASPTS